MRRLTRAEWARIIHAQTMASEAMLRDGMSEAEYRLALATLDDYYDDLEPESDR